MNSEEDYPDISFEKELIGYAQKSIILRTKPDQFALPLKTLQPEEMFNVKAYYRDKTHYKEWYKVSFKEKECGF